MQHSEELRDLTLRFYKASATGDLSFFDRHVSRQEGAQFIGTDSNEWWEALEALREAARTQSEAIEGGRLQIVGGQLQAYSEGNVGWVIDRNASFRLPIARRYPSVIPACSVGRTVNGNWSMATPRSASGARSCLGRTSPLPLRGTCELRRTP